MDDKLMFVPNKDEQNYPFCRFKLRLKFLNNACLNQSPKKLSQQLKERDYKTLGTTTNFNYQSFEAVGCYTINYAIVDKDDNIHKREAYHINLRNFYFKMFDIRKYYAQSISNCRFKY